uniref:G protein complex alpha subunit GpaB n=1 Tax=Ganoderma boninense TaxID=34458 RepID=A0A5K1JRP6_9APHY|nr:G protein complex alpha subunit GpaB [Ganoderma boninense]
MHKRDKGVEHHQAVLLPEPVPKVDAKAAHPHSASRVSDSGFSRHDSLFSFGVPPARNAAELKSLLGNSSSRLRPGAAVLPHHTQTVNKASQAAHIVSLERAKSRARVEVDIILESDCCIAGGYLRGHVRLHVRKRQKKEAPVLLADGRVRVIGFESIPSTREYHTFYQRASALSAITDAYTRVYDTPPDGEGFSRAMEGVHVLPFAMYLSEDDMFGSAKGTANIHSGASLRYIAMMVSDSSVKIKDSQTLKRSIAHFYRDCQVWPRLNLNAMLSTPSRPIQASSARTLSAIGGGGQLKLMAMLHRSTWIAGQRCYVRIGLGNDTKRTVRTVILTLIRTTTLFKYRPGANSDGSQSPEKDPCQTTTAHKVVAESCLEKSRSASKHHASTEASAGALAPDVHVALPLRIINFLSVDPTPSDPLLSCDGSYARLVPIGHSPYLGTSTIQSDIDHTAQYSLSDLSTISITPLSESPSPSMSPLSGYHSSTPAPATPASAVVLDLLSGDVSISDPSLDPIDPRGHDPVTLNALQMSASRHDAAAPPTSESGASMYSTDSNPSSPSPVTPRTFDQSPFRSSSQASGNLELQDVADSEGGVVGAIDTMHGGLLSGRTHSTTTEVYPRRSQGRSSMQETDSAGKITPAPFSRTSRARSPTATFATSPSMIVRGNAARQEELAGPAVAPVSSMCVSYDDTQREGSSILTFHPSADSCVMSELDSRRVNRNLPDGLLDASHTVYSRHRPPSRSLPQPPSQPEPLSGIPVSASAVEAHRQPQLSESSRIVNADSRSATATAGPVPSSVHAGLNGARSTVVRRSPLTHSVSASNESPVHRSSGPPLSSPRAPGERAGTVPVSTSSSTIRAHPADMVHRNARSNSSVVKGRIAAYEERLRYSRDSSVGET